MSRYLIWVVLNDGVSERVDEDHVDAVEEAAVIDRALLPISLGERGRATGGRDTPYTVTGDIGGKRALLRLWDESAPLADIGVCLHSRAAAGLWADLHCEPADDLTDINMPASPPWIGVRCFAPESIFPAWFDSWTKTVGMALLRREGW